MFPVIVTLGLLMVLPASTATSSSLAAAADDDDDAMHSVHLYNSSRDYLHVTSENFPATYPAGHSYTWEWTAQGGGHWGVYFEVFDLVCYPENDVLIIKDPISDKTFVYKCQTSPNQLYFPSSFSMKLVAKQRNGNTVTEARGFKCHVFHAETKDGVEAKINQMKAASRKLPPPAKDETQGLSGTEIALILIIILLIVVVSVTHCVIKRRRQHHHQHTTNTSVTVNIDSVRRDSSVSYTRGGLARLRFDSEDDSASPRSTRPNKRSENSATWAQRATSAGNGSVCVSSKQGRGSQKAVTNHYTPLPVPDTAQGVSVNVRSQRGGQRVGSRGLGGTVLRTDSTLSAISEETSEAMLSTSCQLHEDGGFSALAAEASSGYIAMNSCSTDYINCGRE